MKKNLVFESITTLQVGDRRVRVWRTEESIGAQHSIDLAPIANELSVRDGEVTNAEILETFAALPNVSAVEVTNILGDGSIVRCSRTAAPL